MGMDGVAAMVRAAVWLEISWRAGGSKHRSRCPQSTGDLYLRSFGRHLFYSVLLDGCFVFLSAQPMDCGDSLERLVAVGDGPEGWKTLCHLIVAFERSGIPSLTPKPIQLGEPGSSDCLVIG